MNTQPNFTFEEFQQSFRRSYPYLHHELSDAKVKEFLNQDIIQRVSLNRAMDYFSDYLQANQLCDVSY